jgi:hypothetical protein
MWHISVSGQAREYGTEYGQELVSAYLKLFDH